MVLHALDHWSPPFAGRSWHIAHQRIHYTVSQSPNWRDAPSPPGAGSLGSSKVRKASVKADPACVGTAIPGGGDGMPPIPRGGLLRPPPIGWGTPIFCPIPAPTPAPLEADWYDWVSSVGPQCLHGNRAHHLHGNRAHHGHCHWIPWFTDRSHYHQGSHSWS